MVFYPSTCQWQHFVMACAGVLTIACIPGWYVDHRLAHCTTGSICFGHEHTADYVYRERYDLVRAALQTL